MAQWSGVFIALPEVQVQVLASTSGSSSLQLQEISSSKYMLHVADIWQALSLSLSAHTHTNKSFKNR